jgi:uncharacterized protein YqjF (DUF2071 family)
MQNPLAQLTHRPYAIPPGPWVMHQSWHDLLFAHWPIPVEVMREAVPESLPLDTFEGQAWVGVVPFRMSDVRPRFVPPVPGLSAFPELNVRTYVKVGDKAGVYFFSLEAANAAAVQIARTFFHLPYFNARMILRDTSDWIYYHSKRTHVGAPAADFEGRYRPVSEPYTSQGGSLECWLTERYCLYSSDKNGKLYRGEIHHIPWPLQKAEADITVNTMTVPHGLSLPDTAPLLHFARRLDVVVWPLTAV